MNPLETQKQRELVLEYASLAIRKLKLGEGSETIDSDQNSEIESRMRTIRNDLNLGHMTILSKATDFVN